MTDRYFFFPYIGPLMTPIAVNYVAISEALSISPSVVAAGVAADNVICAVYFMILFSLASKVPPEISKSASGNALCSLIYCLVFIIS